MTKILRINPKSKVVMGSGYSASGQANRVMSAVEKGFVQKPYNITQLLTTIREVLDEDILMPVNTKDGR